MTHPDERHLGHEAIAYTGTQPPAKHARGEVIAYSPVPMVCIRSSDGHQTWWRADLTDVVGPPAPKAGDAASDPDPDPAHAFTRTGPGGSWRVEVPPAWPPLAHVPAQPDGIEPPITWTYRHEGQVIPPRPPRQELDGDFLDDVGPETHPARDASSFRRVVAAARMVRAASRAAVEADVELNRAIEEAREDGLSWSTLLAAMSTYAGAAPAAVVSEVIREHATCPGCAKAAASPVVHWSPLPGAALTRCCSRELSELPAHDEHSPDVDAMTCPGPAGPTPARDEVSTTVVHEAPGVGEGLTRCCYRTPFEVSRGRITTNPADVTCRGLADKPTTR